MNNYNHGKLKKFCDNRRNHKHDNFKNLIVTRDKSLTTCMHLIVTPEIQSQKQFSDNVSGTQGMMVVIPLGKVLSH